MPIHIDDYRDKVAIADGAWDTKLDELGCPAGCCREEWNITEPELVQQVAEAYVGAGAQIIGTNTFGGNAHALGRYDRRDKVVEFNRAGAQISKKASGDRACVFGSIGPSGKIVLMGEVTENDLLEAFKQQAHALAEGGADALVVEGMTELAEATIAVRAAKTTGLAVVASMVFDSGPERTETAMGVAPAKAVEGLLKAGADGVGCNVSLGSDSGGKVTKAMRSATDKPIWVKADAGPPEIEGAKIVYTMTPQEYADKAKSLVEAGANIIGGCHGTSPDFVRALCAAFLD